METTNATPASRAARSPAWHAAFLRLLPQIRRVAKFRFRHLGAELRAELTQEVVVASLKAFARLWEQGRGQVATGSSLGSFAVGQALQGRQVGTRLNVNDVSSRHCQLARGLKLERLDEFDNASQSWREILVEDRGAGPAEVAGCRLDVAAWLETMSRHRRQIAEYLARGESTLAAARRFALSPGRISQVRRELHTSWQAFHGEETASGAAA